MEAPTIEETPVATTAAKPICRLNLGSALM